MKGLLDVNSYVWELCSITNGCESWDDLQDALRPLLEPWDNRLGAAQSPEGIKAYEDIVGWIYEELYLSHAWETIRGVKAMRLQKRRLPKNSRVPVQLPVNLGNKRHVTELMPLPERQPACAEIPPAVPDAPNPYAWTTGPYKEWQYVLCHTHGHERTGENINQDEKYRPVCRAKEWDAHSASWSYRRSCKDRQEHTLNLMCSHHWRARTWTELDYSEELDAMVCDGPKGNHCWSTKYHPDWLHIW